MKVIFISQKNVIPKDLEKTFFFQKQTKKHKNKLNNKY